jgi:hypothetical protein
MTKREMFNLIATVNADNQEIVDFCNHEIELLDNKKTSPRKPTKNQLENVQFKQDILDVLMVADAPMSIKELMVACESIADLSNQRITRLLTDLRKDGKVYRTSIKKVAHFGYGAEQEGE